MNNGPQKSDKGQNVDINRNNTSPNKEKQKDKKKQDSELLRGLLFFTQTGISMAACVFVGVFLGRYLDKLLGSSPWLLLIFSLLGAGAAFKAMFDLANRK